MKNKSLSLTIVIPAYNEQDYIKDCLTHISRQTVKPLEVIVVDNNSTDRTVEIARKFSFVSVIHEKSQGVTFARNAGFNAVKTDLIGRIDADTHLADDWVEKTINALSTNRYSAVTGDCFFYDFPLAGPFHHLHKFIYYTLQRWIAGTDILWGSNMAIRRSAWLAVKSRTTTRVLTHEDIDLSLQLKKAGLKIKHVNSMRATVSLRRGELGIRSLNRYLSAWHNTYWVNKSYFRSFYIFILGVLTLLSAILFWPFQRFVK